MEKRLCDLKTGDTSEIVSSAHMEAAMACRLSELGFTEGATVRCVGKSPLGGMKAYLVKGAVIALRDRDAADISVNVQTSER